MTRQAAPHGWRPWPRLRDMGFTIGRAVIFLVLTRIWLCRLGPRRRR